MDWRVLLAVLALVAGSTALGQDTISGTVRDESGNGIAGIEISAGQRLGGTFWSVQGSTLTDSQGAFVLSGLPAGDYYVYTSEAGVYGRESYPGAVIYNDVVGGTPVPAGSSGIDFQLELGASVSGVITSGGAPLGGYAIKLVGDHSEWLEFTSSDGRYAFPIVPAGSYRLFTEMNMAHIDQAYPDLACEPSCEGGHVTLAAGENLSADFDLTLIPTFKVEVRSESGSALSNVPVELRALQGTTLRQVTDVFGETVFEPSAGSYQVFVESPDDFYLSRYADGPRCSSALTDLCDADLAPYFSFGSAPVSLAVTLERGTQINVALMNDPQLVAGELLAYTATGELAYRHITTENMWDLGSINNFPLGRYLFLAVAEGYVPALPDGALCIDYACSFEDANTELSPGGSKDFFIPMTAGGQIETQLSEALPDGRDKPLAGVRFALYSDAGDLILEKRTGPAGRVEIHGVPAGTAFRALLGDSSQVWAASIEGTSCPYASCTITALPDVTLSPGQVMETGLIIEGETISEAGME